MPRNRRAYDAVELRRTDFKRCFDAGMNNAQVLDLIRKVRHPCRRARRGIWLAVRDRRRKQAAVRGVPRNSARTRSRSMRHVDERPWSGRRGRSAEAIKYLKRCRRHRRRVQAQARDRIQFAASGAQLGLGVQTRADRGRRQGELRLSDRRLSFHPQRLRRPRFESVPAEKIFCFQYSDLPPKPVTGVRRPTDRLAAGQGRRANGARCSACWREKDYTGYLSYEAPNPEQWARSPYDVAREGVELTRKLLRDAVPDYVT